jgi:large subunit ribosomal protein L6
MDIPEGVEVKVEHNVLRVKGPKGEVVKVVKGPVSISVEGNTVVVRSPDYAIQKTWESVVNNAFKGVLEGYVKRLKMVYAHFPFTVEVKGDKAYISNFLGEKKPRVAKLMPGVKVSVKGKEVVVEGCDKEMVGQTVANLKQALKIRNKDERIFQDGLYLSEV